MDDDRAGVTNHHPVLRVSDLVAPGVDPADVLAVLTARGIPYVVTAPGQRAEAVRGDVRAIVTTTRAGTVVTLERRTAWTAGRRRRLRELARHAAAVTAALTRT